MSSFITASHSFDEAGLVPGHDLPTVVKSAEFSSGLSNEIEPGTLLKLNTGTYEPWIQGTDAEADIEGVYLGASPLDTTSRTSGPVLRFGPVTQGQLVSWTAANGSSTAAPTDAALVALENNAPSIFAIEPTVNQT
jgi:hypothetical protein